MHCDIDLEEYQNCPVRYIPLIPKSSVSYESSWRVRSPLKLNKEIMSSLQRLPLLGHIYLDFGLARVPYGRLLIGSGFASLKSISLVNIYDGRLKEGEIDVITEDIRCVLASCSYLENVHVTAPDFGRLDIDFWNMVKDIPSLPNFSPSLTALRLRGVALSLTPPLLQYLAKLRSLDIHNVQPSDEQTWEIMTSHKLKLEIVKVAVITSSLVNYLLHYRGLREFHVLQGGLAPSLTPKPDGEAKRQLLHSALPHHQDTLAMFHAQLLRSTDCSTPQILELRPEEIADLKKAIPGLNDVKITYGYPAQAERFVSCCF
jgi:Leucine-rich repeat (LRR) protein